MIKIKNSNVNSGNEITIYGDISSISLKKNNMKDPTIAESDTFNIVSGERRTIENPKIVIKGSYDVNKVEANEMNEKLLKDLWRNRIYDTYLTLTVRGSVQISNWMGSNDTNYGSDWNIKVMIDSIDITFSGEEQHLCSYTIVMTEVN